MIQMGRARTAPFAVVPLLVACLATACGGAGSDAPDAEPAATNESADAVEAAPAGAAATTLIDANAAMADELGAVLGSIPGAVEAIVAGRPFSRPSELHAALAAAVGDDAARQAYETVWVPMDLNDATRDEIMLIPGLSERMAHEFEEYRPYVDMDQFRREIGKYVDEDEVARLERYVAIK